MTENVIFIFKDEKVSTVEMYNESTDTCIEYRLLDAFCLIFIGTGILMDLFHGLVLFSLGIKNEKKKYRLQMRSLINT